MVCGCLTDGKKSASVANAGLVDAVSSDLDNGMSSTSRLSATGLVSRYSDISLNCCFVINSLPMVSAGQS